MKLLRLHGIARIRTRDFMVVTNKVLVTMKHGISIWSVLPFDVGVRRHYYRSRSWEILYGLLELSWKLFEDEYAVRNLRGNSQ